jgi:predicted DNA-binding WGR domain protein
MMDAAKKREEERIKDKVEKEEELVPVDKTGRFEKSYKVFVENLKPWDCYLTKVDLKNGIYGDYVFYKM